jgi:mitochondrial fission protein ELM1
LRRQAQRGFYIHIQNPRVPASLFDLVIAPAHDGLEGENVLTTRGSLGLINRARLDTAAAVLRPRLAGLPRPLLAVLVGGDSRHRRLDSKMAAIIAGRIAKLAGENGASLLVTASRRTGTEVTEVFRDILRPLPGLFRQEHEENPYAGYLGCADTVLVTEDSINMTSEACATGKPVYVIPLPRRGIGRGVRLARFHADMRNAGYCRPFADRLDWWDYQPLDETARIAAEIRGRMSMAEYNLVIGA